MCHGAVELDSLIDKPRRVYPIDNKGQIGKIRTPVKSSMEASCADPRFIREDGVLQFPPTDALV